MLNEGEKQRCWMSFHRVCDERCIAFVEVHAPTSCGLLNMATGITCSLRTIARHAEGPMSGTQPPSGAAR